MSLPEGFCLEPDFLSDDGERDLLAALAPLELGQVRMRGQVGRRQVAHFGWLYGYESFRVQPGPALPGPLVALRERAGAWAHVAPERFEEALVTRYPPGASIGWHRDAMAFGSVVIGVSLGGWARLRFARARAGTERERAQVELPPRSIYALTGPARWSWQHALSPVKAERWSVTFRTLSRRAQVQPPAGDQLMGLPQ